MPLIRCRAVVMRSPPAFMRGAHKSILMFALQEPAKPMLHTTSSVCRGWKEAVLVGSTHVFIPQRTRWIDTEESASGKVRPICTR